MRKPHAALAATLMAATTVAACDSDDVIEVTSTVTAPVAEEAAVTESATATGTPTPTGPLVRDAEEFRIFPDAAHPAYAVQVSPTTMCTYFDKEAAQDAYFDCNVELTGNVPPLDIDHGIGGSTDVFLWDPAIGFAATHDVGGGEGVPPAVKLHPGEQVTIAKYTFTQFANGTARVEREGHWFEVDPTGQFSSDRF